MTNDFLKKSKIKGTSNKMKDTPHTSTDCQRLDSLARAGAKSPTQAQMKTTMERSPRIVPRKFIIVTPSAAEEPQDRDDEAGAGQRGADDPFHQS